MSRAGVYLGQVQQKAATQRKIQAYHALFTPTLASLVGLFFMSSLSCHIAHCLYRQDVGDVSNGEQTWRQAQTAAQLLLSDSSLLEHEPDAAVFSKE